VESITFRAAEPGDFVDYVERAGVRSPACSACGIRAGDARWGMIGMRNLFSAGVLLALVFAATHAPTFQRRGDALHSNAETNSSAFDVTTTSPRDFAEDDSIKRFLLDDFYLPTLDVSVPVLFDWSDDGREYLADVRHPDTITAAPGA